MLYADCAFKTVLRFKDQCFSITEKWFVDAMSLKTVMAHTEVLICFNEA